MIVITWPTPSSSRWPSRGGARRNPAATERARAGMWRRRVSGDGREEKKLRKKSKSGSLAKVGGEIEHLQGTTEIRELEKGRRNGSSDWIISLLYACIWRLHP